MNKPLPFFGIILLIGLAIFLATQKIVRPHDVSGSAYERVLKSGTIRCGYILYPPNTIKDPNTGKLSGISYDIMIKIAQDLWLNLNWVEEVTPATMVEGIQTNRYDMLCTNV